MHASADYGPYGLRRDEKVEKALRDKDIDWVTTGSPYAVAPGRVRKPDGSRYAVFTPYFRGWSAHGYRGPAGSGRWDQWIDPADVTAVEAARPGRVWGQASAGAWSCPSPVKPPPWPPGGTSWPGRSPTTTTTAIGRITLAPAGCRRISSGAACTRGRCWPTWQQHRSSGAASYRRELAWREFYADVVFHLPSSVWTSVDPVIDNLPWDTGQQADARFDAWKQGRTGYPYIDAGMRQLLAEGWMHNRVRMGTASFLIKDLHLPWQDGAKHFLEHLVDGDYASNNHGWQWVAGSGPQASAFYRVFNPIGQGEKFDPTGDYVRTFVPELRGIAGKAVHRPWELGADAPADYPEPIVDHPTERAEALRRWESRPRTR